MNSMSSSCGDSLFSVSISAWKTSQDNNLNFITLFLSSQLFPKDTRRKQLSLERFSFPASGFRIIDGSIISILFVCIQHCRIVFIFCPFSINHIIDMIVKDGICQTYWTNKIKSIQKRNFILIRIFWVQI